MERCEIELRLNGSPTALSVPARATLADALRDEAGLTGTHLGCEQGVCGACTVLLDGQPVRSCLVLAAQAADCDVTTVEGLAPAGEMNAVQRKFVEHHALQCGFCTPGFVVLATALLKHEPDASPARLKEVLASNLCRCTGYQPIVRAVEAAQREAGGS
jgi:aerobic-type carbon monoxide dehydrogenase small subunit (CoxS/CutS family)